MFRMRRSLAVVLVLLALVPLTVAACGGSSSGSSGNTNVTLNMSDFKFDSSVTTFTSGTTYHFTMKNTGKVPHEVLFLPDTSMDASKAVLSVGPDKLPPGGTTTVDFAFTAPGAYQMACLLPGHYEQGMHIPITVK